MRKFINTNKGKLYYSPRFLYVGIKQIDKKLALDNLKLVSEILNKQKLVWGPMLGTLLGIVRENDFIAWDEDVDLYILEEEEEIFKDCLYDIVQSGFELIRYERRGLYSIARNGEYIDFYVLKKLSPELRHSGGSDFIFDKYLTDTVNRDFKGVTVAVPRMYDEFLTFHYGDWRTPVKWADFGMPLWKKWIEKTKCFIKNNLPDSIYYPLLAKYHKKDLEKFRKKCALKGVYLAPDIKIQYNSRKGKRIS